MGQGLNGLLKMVEVSVVLCYTFLKTLTASPSMYVRALVCMGFHAS